MRVYGTIAAALCVLLSQSLAQFDCTSTYGHVMIGGDATSWWNASASYTICAWINYTAKGALFYGPPLHCQQAANPYNGRALYMQQNTGKAATYKYPSMYVSTGSVSAGTWHLIIFHGYKNAAGYVKASFDGKAFETVLSGDLSTTLNVTNPKACIGLNSTYPPEQFDGHVGKVEIFLTGFTNADASNYWQSAAYPTNGTQRLAPVLSMSRFAGIAGGAALPVNSYVRNFGTGGATLDALMTNNVASLSASVDCKVFKRRRY